MPIKEVLTIEQENKYKRFMINMVYKLLPLREEGADWQKYLDSILLEIRGFRVVFGNDEDVSYIRLLSKLEGLRELADPASFIVFRKIVFECTNLIEIKEVGETIV